jgi:hypothetical protein
MGGPRREVYTDRELKKAAESVIVALGFSGGVEDLQVCGNDVTGLRDWFAINHALEKQLLMDVAIHTAAASTWPMPLGVDGLPGLRELVNTDMMLASVDGRASAHPSTIARVPISGETGTQSGLSLIKSYR